MKKVLFKFILMWFCLGNDSLEAKHLHKNDISFKPKQEFVQVGHINEFVLDQGHPFKKSSAFGYAIIQQGKLKEFVLDRGYPSKIKFGQTMSNFKIIGEY
tara:strand:- start:299 stop:598 length:300 start_codon:yes stop_codon:yes gene_type:complete